MVTLEHVFQGDHEHRHGSVADRVISSGFASNYQFLVPLYAAKAALAINIHLSISMKSNVDSVNFSAIPLYQLRALEFQSQYDRLPPKIVGSRNRGVNVLTVNCA